MVFMTLNLIVFKKYKFILAFLFFDLFVNFYPKKQV